MGPMLRREYRLWGYDHDCLLCSRYGTAHYGTSAVVHTMVPVLLCTLWFQYCFAHYGTSAVVHTMVPVLLCTLWYQCCCAHYGASAVVHTMVPVLLCTLCRARNNFFTCTAKLPVQC